MKPEVLQVLLVEDNLGDAELLQELLEEATGSEFEVKAAIRLSDALTHLSENNYEAILLDLSLPDSQGLDTLVRVQEVADRQPIIVLTGLNDEEIAVRAVRQGAQDYLIKGQLNGVLLGRAIRYAIERKRAEMAMRYALDQEREMRELKSRFVSTISHELRSPLTTIFASADLLHKFSSRLNECKKGEMHQQIKAAAQRMNQLLDDVLTIWKAESAEQPLIPVLMDLKQFCRDLVEEFHIQLEDLQSSHRGESDRTIVFVSDCSSCPACVDRNLLRQILSNLLSNAIKYSPQGGTVRLELNCDGSNAIFRVKDEGIGIPESDLDKLFSTFYRASNAGGIYGTGLGLAIVKKAVELHGGAIAVSSEIGVGSTFTVTLPLSPTFFGNPSRTVEEKS